MDVHPSTCFRRTLILCALVVSLPSLGQEEVRDAPRRMGAYQCLDCINGGFLQGIRPGAHGRVKRDFPPNRSLCVARYQYIEGEQYVFFQLDKFDPGRDGAWTVRRRSSAAGYNLQGDRYGRIQLDDGPWPDDGAWGVKSNSWNAQCHKRKRE